MSARRDEDPEEHERRAEGAEEVTHQPSLLAEMRERRERGDISGEDFKAFRKAWTAHQKLQKRFELIEEVARQHVAREDATRQE